MSAYSRSMKRIVVRPVCVCASVASENDDEKDEALKLDAPPGAPLCTRERVSTQPLTLLTLSETLNLSILRDITSGTFHKDRMPGRSEIICLWLTL